MHMIGLVRIGRDAELKQTNNGKAVLNVPLAYSYGKEGTQWIEAAMFGERAEKVAQYFTKGKALCVSLDNVHVETYAKKDGSTGVKLTAMIASFEFAGSNKAEPKQDETPRQKVMGGIKNMDDDIPF